MSSPRLLPFLKTTRKIKSTPHFVIPTLQPLANLFLSKMHGRKTTITVLFAPTYITDNRGHGCKNGTRYGLILRQMLEVCKNEGKRFRVSYMICYTRHTFYGLASDEEDCVVFCNSHKDRTRTISSLQHVPKLENRAPKGC